MTKITKADRILAKHHLNRQKWCVVEEAEGVYVYTVNITYKDKFTQLDFISFEDRTDSVFEQLIERVAEQIAIMRVKAQKDDYMKVIEQ